MKQLAHLLASRRQVLAGGAVLAAATAEPVSGATALIHDVEQAASRASVVLHDRRIPLDAAVQQRLARNGARIVVLDDDPVRMWRSEIGAVLAHPETRLLGVTRWVDYLMVRGLAAESRRYVRYARHAPQSNAIIWLIS